MPSDYNYTRTSEGSGIRRRVIRCAWLFRMQWCYAWFVFISTSIAGGSGYIFLRVLRSPRREILYPRDIITILRRRETIIIVCRSGTRAILSIHSVLCVSFDGEEPERPQSLCSVYSVQWERSRKWDCSRTTWSTGMQLSVKTMHVNCWHSVKWLQCPFLATCTSWLVGQQIIILQGTENRIMKYL